MKSLENLFDIAKSKEVFNPITLVAGGCAGGTDGYALDILLLTLPVLGMIEYNRKIDSEREAYVRMKSENKEYVMTKTERAKLAFQAITCGAIMRGWPVTVGYVGSFIYSSLS
ncbi:MAG: hypothetical protein ACE5FT_01740 [Candidatus Nanoarchaeia archaeon]